MGTTLEYWQGVTQSAAAVTSVQTVQHVYCAASVFMWQTLPELNIV